MSVIKSLETGLFNQQPFQANSRRNIKAPPHWPFVMETDWSPMDSLQKANNAKSAVYPCYEVTIVAPANSLTKAYDVTIQRYRNSHAKIEDSKMHILRCMGLKFCVKFQRRPLKISKKIFNPYPYTHTQLWHLKFLTLSETGPWWPFHQYSTETKWSTFRNFQNHFLQYKYVNFNQYFTACS